MKTKPNPNYIARLWSGDASNHPVKIVKGDQEPKLKGHSGYHTTPSGKTVVRHPGAYGYRTVYHLSTLHTEVGRNWLHMHRGHEYHRSKDGTLCVITPKKYHFKIHGFTVIPGFSNYYRLWIILGEDKEYHAYRMNGTPTIGYARIALRVAPSGMEKTTQN